MGDGDFVNQVLLAAAETLTRREELVCYWGGALRVSCRPKLYLDWTCKNNENVAQSGMEIDMWPEILVPSNTLWYQIR